MLERKGKYPTRSKIYGEPALPQRILRDFIGANLEKIHIDSKLCFNEVKEFTNEFMPENSHVGVSQRIEAKKSAQD